jgi:uncharacterized protein YecE (DUF72 family)
MIRVGIGGWTFEPWRGTFYPKGLTHARELEFASREMTAIEINGTFYRTQKPETFRKWRDETPEGFVFAVKAPAYATNRSVLADAGQSIERFFASGVFELGARLGPILWQFMPTKKFDPADFEAFLALLPHEGGGMKVRNAVEVRHASFKTLEFVALARKYGAAVVFADSAKHPAVADPTADFMYARLQRAAADVPTGYTPAALKTWLAVARAWEAGGVPEDLPLLGKAPAKKKRDVFVFMINGAKERAPAAAKALLALMPR